MTYELVKWLHILSATILFGTGLGSAFYKRCADRSGNLQAIAHTNRIVVLADWMFTAPTILIQPLTGVLLLQTLDLPLTTPWVMVAIALYLLAGACWLPVVWLQIRMRRLSLQALRQDAPLDAAYRKLARIWFWLGVPAFITMMIIFFLMVFKPVISL